MKPFLCLLALGFAGCSSLSESQNAIVARIGDRAAALAEAYANVELAKLEAKQSGLAK